MWFTRISLQNPVFATMMMLLLVVLGAFSIKNLQVDQFPNIDIPVVVITTEYPGASPEVVESEVSKKMEEGVNSVAGISAVTSRSYENLSVVILEFQLTVDGRQAAIDVREKVAAIRPNLRAEVKEPRVQRFDPASKAIWSVAVLPSTVRPELVKGQSQALPGSAQTAAPKTLSAVELTNWADQVFKKRLESVRGVGAVSLVGGTKRTINVYLNPQAMESLGITADQIVNAVKGENQDLPVGAIRNLTQERTVQIDARMKTPSDFNDIIVTRKGGAAVRLNQVAQVVDGAPEVDSLALYNGQRTLLLSVQKSQDENTIAVVDGLNQTLKDIQTQLKNAGDASIQLEPVSDASRPIRVGVDNVRRTLIEGALLTILIVFLFLNSWRSTVITGLTLPISLIATFLFMNLFGFTINMITLMALSLCVGLLIDDAIVVRENIVRHIQMGKTPYDASMEGTKEIGLAVLATTLSIVAVFLPVGFMGGIIGKFFHQFGITIVAAVLVSMFVSFTLDPMLSSVWHDPAIDTHGGSGQPLTAANSTRMERLYEHTIGRVTGWFDRATTWLEHQYQAALGWALLHKLSTVLAALAIFIASLAMIPLLGTEFVPKADFSETSISFYTPVGSSIENTEAKAKQVEAIVREFKEVRYTLSTINTGTASGKMYASIYVRLVDRKDRSLSVDQMSATLRDRLSKVAGITVTHIGLLDAVGGNKQVEFSITGTDQHELERLATLAMNKLKDVKGLVDLDSSMKPNKPTIDVTVMRDAATDTGLTTAQMGSQLRTLVAGQTVGNWRDSNDQTYDVNVQLAPSSRRTPADLARLPFFVGANSDGTSRIVRLNQIATVTESTGANQINRRDLQREVAINANTYGVAAGEVSAGIKAALETISFPPGYGYQFSGSTKNMTESFGYATAALLMAIIFIYMVLASQFKSFIQPIALMSSLPLTLIGVVAALMAFRSTLSMFSIIGVIMLMGLVTKNAILLVDFAIRSREQGMARSEALLHAAKVRLRPILMTTLAMIFGMVPLAFALSEGSEQRAPMGQAVIGGVITSSILTLVVVPVIYCYLDDLSAWAKATFSSSPRRLGSRAP
ncbi:MAG: efflux RND transporter permease subunit [Cytophagales bacterium]|nr:efflux RND transporter permease subunit [Cytophagales bacterium]